MHVISTVILILGLLGGPADAFISQPDTLYGHIDPSVVIPYRGLDTIMALPDPDMPPYGVYCWHWSFNWYYDALDEIGFTHFRFGTERGQDLDGAENFATEDQTMQNLVNGGWESHFTLWISSRDDYGNDDDFMADYLTYVDSMITRYGPGGTFFDDYPALPYRPMKYFEVWNEPNLYYLSLRANQSQMDDEEFSAWFRHLYARMLVEVYALVRSKPEWDSVKIVGFCTDGGNQNDVGWGGSGGYIEDVHADTFSINGRTAANSYDVLSTHPYASGYCLDMERYYSYWVQWSLAESINEIRRVMRQYRGSEAPIWFTEGGPMRDQVGERLQAAYTVRDYLFAMRMGIERYTVMFLKDSDGCAAGFVSGQRDDIRYYERAYALRTLSRIMPNPKIIGAPCDGTDGYYHMQYKADAGNISSDTVDVVWYTGGAIERQVAIGPGEYHMIDMFGDTVDLDVTGSALTLTIGPYPVYLVKYGIDPVDETPPVVMSVSSFGYYDRIAVRFNEALDAVSAADAANYAVNGGASISAASLGSDGRTVTLTVDPVFAAEGEYILTVGGVEDAAGNAVPAGTETPFEFRQPGTGLSGSYYNDGTDYTDLVTIRTDTQIDFNWADSSPAAGVNADGFGVVWTGYIRVPQSGSYTFKTYSNDGISLTITNYTVISALWDMPSGGNRSGSRYLTAGELYPLEVKYFDNTGNALVTLSWVRPDGTEEVIPQAALYADTTYRSTGIDIPGRGTVEAVRSGADIVVKTGSAALRELASGAEVYNASGTAVTVNAVTAGIHYIRTMDGTVLRVVVIP